MKVDKRFHCFGCQEDGDVIDFVGKLFGLSPKRAAEKLAEDFGVRYEGLQAWHPLFCEALQKMDYVEYLLDELISGTLEERTAIVKEKEKDLAGLEKKIAAFDRRGTADPQRDSFPGRVRSTRFPEELAM